MDKYGQKEKLRSLYIKCLMTRRTSRVTKVMMNMGYGWDPGLRNSTESTRV